jgi:hypothetical protein
MINLETKEIKHFTVPFEIKEISDEGDFFTFKGHASTFGNVDFGDDVVEPGAFKESLKRKADRDELFPALWQHRTSEPVGVYPVIKEDAKGLFVEGKLPKTDTFVTGRVIPQMKVGSVTKMSIGFSCWGLAGSWEIIDGIRHIKKLNLFEISLVTLAENEEATITEMKSMGNDDLKSLPDRELEEKMTSGIKFSAKSAKTIISALKAAGHRDGDGDGHRDGEQRDWSEIITELKKTQQLMEGKTNA